MRGSPCLVRAPPNARRVAGGPAGVFKDGRNHHVHVLLPIADAIFADHDLAIAGAVHLDARIALPPAATTLVIIYSYGDFSSATKVVRSDDVGAKPIEITREASLPDNEVVGFFS